MHMPTAKHVSRDYPAQTENAVGLVEGETRSERKRGSSDGKRNGGRGETGGWEAVWRACREVKQVKWNLLFSRAVITCGRLWYVLPVLCC